MEEGQVDDEDKDPGYQPDVEEEPEDEPEEAEDQPGVSLSQAVYFTRYSSTSQKEEGCKGRKLEIPLQGLQQKISKDI